MIIKSDLNHTNDKTVMPPLSELNDYDHAIYSQTYSKRVYIENLPQMVREKSDDYKILFVTFTFKEMKRCVEQVLYDEFFNRFFDKVHTALTNNKKSRDHLKPFMIVFPENYSAQHYHGILFIHKETMQRFSEKMVRNIIPEFNKKRKRCLISYILKEKFENPYSKSIKQSRERTHELQKIKANKRTSAQRFHLQQTRPVLTIADYRIHPLATDRDFEKVVGYCTKEFLFSNFNDDDVLIYCKTPDLRKSINSCETLINFELQKDTAMPDFASYAEFLEFNPLKFHEARKVITALAENHSVIRAIPCVNRIIRSKKEPITVADISQINQVILERTIHLARQITSANAQERLEMISEQNVLNTASTTLNSAIAVRNQEAFDRLSKLLKIKKI